MTTTTLFNVRNYRYKESLKHTNRFISKKNNENIFINMFKPC